MMEKLSRYKFLGVGKNDKVSITNTPKKERAKNYWQKVFAMYEILLLQCHFELDYRCD
jgi:hypothetical protein